MNDSEIKSVLNFLIVVAAQVEKIIAKGKLSLFDLPELYAAFEAAGPALSDIKDLPAEVKAITPGVMSDIVSYLQTNLGSLAPNPALEGLVNDGLALAQQVVAFVNTVNAVKSPATPAPPAATPPTTPPAAT